VSRFKRLLHSCSDSESAGQQEEQRPIQKRLNVNTHKTPVVEYVNMFRTSRGKHMMDLSFTFKLLGQVLTKASSSRGENKKEYVVITLNFLLKVFH